MNTDGLQENPTYHGLDIQREENFRQILSEKRGCGPDI
jgi:hypothetical protein